MNFISDNQAGAHPAVLTAISDAASGLAEGYGEDALTAAAESAVRDVFETDCAVFFVTTGTAANALAMSALCPPWGAIYCHEGAHIQNDENTAVELYTGGARMVGIAGEGGKPDVALMRAHMEIATVHGVHNAKPGAMVARRRSRGLPPRALFVVKARAECQRTAAASASRTGST